MRQLSAQAAAAILADNSDMRILDVREPWEWELVHIPGAVHIPMAQLPLQWQTLSPDHPWLVLCHHGVRSGYVVEWLAAQGFEQAINLAGGIDAWAREVDPSLPCY
jgi:rhodanese-related sulfurtransferase